MKKRLKKKAISPVIATILLVAIVMIIALIVFLWLRGVVGDYGEKFGKNIELVCEDVVLDTTYLDPYIYITNDGNVPIFKVNVVIAKQGSYMTEELNNLAHTSTPWPEEGLTQGGVYSGDIGGEVSDANEITVIPVLLGLSDKGSKKTFACGEQYGYEIIL